MRKTYFTLRLKCHFARSPAAARSGRNSDFARTAAEDPDHTQARRKAAAPVHTAEVALGHTLGAVRHNTAAGSGSERTPAAAAGSRHLAAAADRIAVGTEPAAAARIAVAEHCIRAEDLPEEVAEHSHKVAVDLGSYPTACHYFAR